MDGMIKGPNDYLKLGSWNCICQRCGVKRKAEDISKEWTGLLVCTDRCLDFRHPQDFVRVKPDDQQVPYTSPPPTDIDVDVTYDTVTGVQEHNIPSGTFDNSR
jgi:hypothetical protein